MTEQETIDQAGNVEYIHTDPPAPRYATLADLTEPPVPVASREEDFELPSGLVVRIRPLTRMEVLIIGKRDLSTDKKEQAFMSKAMVLPAMSEEDVKRWQTNSATGDMQELTERVQEISGMSTKGAKATAKAFPRSGE